jgi:hypothetical protein
MILPLRPSRWRIRRLMRRASPQPFVPAFTPEELEDFQGQWDAVLLQGRSPTFIPTNPEFK